MSGDQENTLTYQRYYLFTSSDCPLQNAFEFINQGDTSLLCYSNQGHQQAGTHSPLYRMLITTHSSMASVPSYHTNTVHKKCAKQLNKFMSVK